MRTYKLYAALAGTDNEANVQIARNGRIKRLRYAVEADFDADSEYLNIEVSTQSSSQMATSDTIGDIDCVRGRTAVGAAGTVNGIINIQRDIDYPVAQGERLYLHSSMNVAVAKATVYIDIDEK